MSFHKRNCRDLSAPGQDFFVPYNLLYLVISSFNEDVWLKGFDQFERRVFVEGNNTIDVKQARQQLHSCRQGHNGPAISFEPFYAFVGIHSDNKALAQTSGLGQVGKVAWMDKVKNTVGKHGFLTVGTPATAAAAEFQQGQLLISN